MSQCAVNFVYVSDYTNTETRLQKLSLDDNQKFNQVVDSEWLEIVHPWYEKRIEDLLGKFDQITEFRFPYPDPAGRFIR